MLEIPCTLILSYALLIVKGLVIFLKYLTKNNSTIVLLTREPSYDVILYYKEVFFMKQQIGKKIRSFREKKGLSQLQLVEALKEEGINMKRETLSKIENNSRSISAVELKAISKVLDVSMEDFFDEEEDSMITFFRKRNFSQDALKGISELQEMVKVFLEQKKMYLEEK